MISLIMEKEIALKIDLFINAVNYISQKNVLTFIYFLSTLTELLYFTGETPYTTSNIHLFIHS